MRITIKQSPQSRTLTFPIPFKFTVNLLVRESLFRVGLKGKKNERFDYEKCIDAIDFKMLRYACHQLATTRGLVLVEVAAKDGTYIKIVT